MRGFLDEKHLLTNGTQIWQILSIKSGDIVNFHGESIVGEIERQFFCLALCAGDLFESLVKFTPDVNFINILHAIFFADILLPKSNQAEL